MRYVIEYSERESMHTVWQLSGNYEWLPSGRRGPRRIKDIEFASLEDAQRQAALQQAQSIGNIYRARDTQPEVQLTREGAYEMAATQTNRSIRIYRRNREWVVDLSGRSEPTLASLYPYMTPTARQSCRDRGDYNIASALTHGISPQMLTSAMAAFFTEHPNSHDRVQLEEGTSELADNSAYLAMGDFIYKMVPVRQASSSKAVRLMREKVRIEIERVREGLRAQAASEAQQVIAQANQQAARIRNLMEAERAEQAAALSFPQWLVSQTLKQQSNGQKYVLRESIPINYTGIVFGARRWSPKKDVDHVVHTSMWLPLSGNPELIHLGPQKGSTPHVDSSACMKIGETVQPITDVTSLRRFEGQVARALSVINLASLLNPDYNTWMPEIQALIPDSLKKWLTVYRSRDLQRDPSGVNSLPASESEERAEETWSVR